VLHLFTSSSAFISRADENAAGRWEGTVQIPGRQLTLIVDLAAESGGGGGWQVPLSFLDWDSKVRP